LKNSPGRALVWNGKFPFYVRPPPFRMFRRSSRILSYCLVPTNLSPISLFPMLFPMDLLFLGELVLLTPLNPQLPMFHIRPLLANSPVFEGPPFVLAP